MQIDVYCWADFFLSGVSFFLTPLLLLAAPIFYFNPSSWRGGQGDAHKGEKAVSALHHEAPNDANPIPLTEEKVATGATGMGDNMLDWWSSIRLFFASNNVNKTWKVRLVILVLFPHVFDYDPDFYLGDSNK